MYMEKRAKEQDALAAEPTLVVEDVVLQERTIEILVRNASTRSVVIHGYWTRRSSCSAARDLPDQVTEYYHHKAAMPIDTEDVDISMPEETDAEWAGKDDRALVTALNPGVLRMRMVVKRLPKDPFTFQVLVGYGEAGNMKTLWIPPIDYETLKGQLGLR